MLALAVVPGWPAEAQTDDVPIPRVSPLWDSASRDASSAGRAAEAGDDLFSADLFADFGAGGTPLSLTPGTSGVGAGAPIDLTRGSGSMNLGPEPAISPKGDRIELGILNLEARLTDDGPPIASGMTWRVFGDSPDVDGRMRLVGEATGGPVTLKLRPGDYYVHASYGRAAITKKVRVQPGSKGDTVVLDAGGLRLTALVGEDQPLPSADVNFDIYGPDESGTDERVLIVSEAPAATVIGLNAGIYHIVCRYGDANAVVRADIKVEPGKVTDATLYQKAARLTLKLVEEHGGEALANTSWSVITPAGDAVTDSVGAFPSVVLAEGEYTAIAKHQDRIYERTFKVEAGLNRDVEVLLTR